MSVPEGTKPRWPLRSAGFALLGLAAAAALTGVVLVVSQDGATVSDGRRPGASGPAPGSASAQPSATPPPSSAPATTTTPAPTSRPARTAPPAPTTRPGPVVPSPAEPGALPPGTDTDVAASGKGERRGDVRIYNNSTIHGLAARAASELTAAGWTVAQVGNYPGGRIWTTTVYYQEGTDQRAAAEGIGAEFGMRVEPRFPGIADAKPGVIVIVTDDYGS